ncbi:hypothetical protein V2H45_08235 [Tumidithrix elongata RA019]|uniref:Uncharacterized protein n=1 Tax=Tumidithrix elongata BACA0141 TaxID=2716417 RepID=A0AAW9Q1H6_9CYAN|nr:hypothetical protein [Tumidithrix elongata RA019]
MTNGFNRATRIQVWTCIDWLWAIGASAVDIHCLSEDSYRDHDYTGALGSSLLSAIGINTEPRSPIAKLSRTLT